MKTASKIVAKDSCNFAINKGNSNETNIKITPDIALLFGGIAPGESKEVTFYIQKGDFLKNLCNIMTMLPLYNNQGKLVTFSDTLFESLYNELNTFFGDDDTKVVNAILTKPGSHPYCLNFGRSNFKIRDFLVEDHTLMTFTESNGKVRLNISLDKDAEVILNFPENGLGPYQLIFYGAPGTGKSYAVNKLSEGRKPVRTTFYPDLDYSGFVGAYKPTMIKQDRYDVAGHLIRDINGNTVQEDKVVYEFVSQAFLKAYVNAWVKFRDAKSGETPKAEILIIEEINRGNCAQIFGDLFQLLDRNKARFSEYPIAADKDMASFLKESFENKPIPDGDSINKLYNDGADIASEVIDGNILLLPNNLYIWATMNTSDQSLFPIDSAFKRRWDWRYSPICEGTDEETGKPLGWQIDVDGARYDWWEFLQKVNIQVFDATQSEDKELGYFFCKPDEDGVISDEKFVSKVVFYLWNDVFKDFGDEQALFKNKDEKDMTFNQFYIEDKKTRMPVVNTEAVRQFLENLEVKPLTSPVTEITESSEPETAEPGQEVESEDDAE